MSVRGLVVQEEIARVERRLRAQEQVVRQDKAFLADKVAASMPATAAAVRARLARNEKELAATGAMRDELLKAAGSQVDLAR